MKFKYEGWRKLYVGESGTFADLPWFARAAAGELLKVADDAGRIEVGEGEDSAALLAKVVCFRMGATRGDRRLMATLFPLLFTDGYLVRRGKHVVIRNFIQAQRDWRGEIQGDDGPDRDSATKEDATSRNHEGSHESPAADANEPRSVRDPSTTEPRPCNDSATKTEATPQNHGGLSGSSEKRREEQEGGVARVPTREAPAPAPPQGQGYGALPDDAKPAPAVPLPTRVLCPTVEPAGLRGDAALYALREGSGGRLGAFGAAALVARLGELARTAVPDPLTLDDFRLVGEAFAAGAVFGWCKRAPDLDLLTRDDGRHLFAAVAEARTWAEGREGKRKRASAAPYAPPAPCGAPLSDAERSSAAHAARLQLAASTTARRRA